MCFHPEGPVITSREGFVTKWEEDQVNFHPYKACVGGGRGGGQKQQKQLSNPERGSRNGFQVDARQILQY